MLDISITLLLVVHVAVSLLLILVVLMQRPKNEGLGAAFGGGMTENLFGAQTTETLQNFTRWMGVLFIGLTLVLSLLYARKAKYASTASDELLKQPAPAIPALPAATPAATPAPAAAASPEATPAAAETSAPAETPANSAPSAAPSPEAAASPSEPAAEATTTAP